MGELRKLSVEILGDAKELVKAFHEAGEKADGFGSKMGGVAKAAGVALLGVAGAAAGFAEHSLHEFEDTAGEVRKLQRLTGETAESMSHLAFAAEEVGISNETLEGSMKKLSKAVEGNDKNFAKYGIATKDANGQTLSMTDVIQNAADVFAKMPDGIEKNALAMHLFGKSGTDMLPLLNKGKEGIQEFGKEADKFGITIGQKGVDAYAKNVKNSREMHAALKGLEIQIGEKLMPVVTKITTWMAEHLPQAMAFVKKVVEELTPAFQALGQGVAWLVDWFKAHWDQISETVSRVVGYIQGLFETWVAVIEAIWNTFGDAIITYLTGVWDFVKGIFSAAFEVIQGLFDFFRDLFTGKWGRLWGDVVQILTGVWDAIKAYIGFVLDEIHALLQAAWDAIKVVAGIVWDGIKAVITGVWDAIKAYIEFEIDIIKTIISTVWDTIKLVTSTVWDIIKTVISTAVDAVVGFVTGIPDRISNIVSTMWDGIKTAFTDTKNWIGDRISDFVGLFTGLPSRIGNVVSNVFDGIKDAFKGAVNWVIRAWNSIEFTLPSITIPMPWPLSDIHTPSWTIGTPDLPLFHTGGIVPGNGELLAKVKGGEMVLTKSQQANLWNMASSPRPSSSGGDTYVFNFPAVSVGGKQEFLDWVHEGLARKQSRVGSLGLNK